MILSANIFGIQFHQSFIPNIWEKCLNLDYMGSNQQTKTVFCAINAKTSQILAEGQSFLELFPLIWEPRTVSFPSKIQRNYVWKKLSSWKTSFQVLYLPISIVVE